MPAPTKNKIEQLARVLFPRYGIKNVTSLVATIVKYRNNDGHVKVWRPEGGWGWFASPGMTVVTPNLVTLNFPSDYRRNASQASSDLYRQLEDAAYSVMSEDEIEAALSSRSRGNNGGSTTQQHHATKKKSPAQLDREITQWQAARSGLPKHHLDLLSRRKPGGELRAGYLTPTGWHGDPLVIEDPRLRLAALQEQPAPRLPRGRQHSSITKTHTLSPEQLRALHTFANANGTQWKSKLNVAWSTGRYDDYPGTDAYGDLQQVRNTFGPAWLTKFSFSNVKTHSVKR